MPVIALVGGVGVGKTYIGRKLKEQLPSSLFIEEDTSKNLYLNEFYSDMHKWGFHSRISMLSMVLSKTACAYSSDRIVILDRCVDELIVFATKEYEEGNLTEKEFALYQQLFNGVLNLLPRPDIFIYFKCSPETSYRRVNERGRECEKHIEISFLEDVINRYDAWRTKLTAEKVIDLNTEKDIDISSLINDIYAMLNE